MKKSLINVYMETAHLFSSLSTSNRMKVGALAVKNDSILAQGWNGTPRGYFTNECELSDGTTNPYVVHAEENIIAKMARSTESLKDSTIICTHSPCKGCAKLLAQIGIAEFIYKTEYRDTSGLETLVELGVKVTRYEDIRVPSSIFGK
jgi:dCMP deaminase